MPIFNQHSLVMPQPCHLAKKVQLTLVRSLLHTFQLAYDEQHTLLLSSPQKKAQHAIPCSFTWKAAVLHHMQSHGKNEQDVNSNCEILMYIHIHNVV